MKRAIRYLIAFLMFVAVWCTGAILLQIGLGFVWPIPFDGIFIGWGDAWQQWASNIVAAFAGGWLATRYLRGAKKRGIEADPS